MQPESLAQDIRRATQYHARSSDNRLLPWRHFSEDFNDVLRRATAEDLQNRKELKRLAAAVWSSASGRRLLRQAPRPPDRWARQL
jgi:hypothetical protein